MFNVVTVAREYGSGGADVGRKVAELLGWEILDRQIIERVATLGHMDCEWAEEADEQSCAWWERVLASFRHGGLEAYVGVEDEGVDRDVLQRVTRRVIEEAGKQGHCVIIGRASQCVLRDTPNTLHVLVYAPLEEKVERMKLRHPDERDLKGLLHRMDSERARYTRDYYGCDWLDGNLYQLCVNSTMGIDACAELVVKAVQLSESRETAAKTIKSTA